MLELRSFCKKSALDILLLITFTSCGEQEVRKQLERVGEEVYSHPEKAMTELCSIDSQAMKSKSVRTEYNLLYALSMNRLRHDTLNLDYLQSIVGYYEKNGQAQRRAQSEYCLGRAYFEMQDWTSALIHFKLAESECERTDDLYLSNIIHSALAAVSSRNNRIEEWEYYIKKAYEESVRLGNREFVRQNTLALAAAYGQNHKFRESDSLYKIAFNALLEEKDVSLNELLTGVECAISKRHNEPFLSARLYEMAREKEGEIDRRYSYAYSYALLLLGHIDRVNQMLDSLKRFPATSQSYYWNYRISKYKGDYASALTFCERYSNANRQCLIDEISRSITKVHSEMLMSKSAANTARNRQLFLSSLLVLSFVLLVVSVILFHNRTQKVRLERKMDMIEAAACESERLLALARQDNHHLLEERGTAMSERDRYQVRLDNLQQSFCHAYQQRFALLGRLCESVTPMLEKEKIKGKVVDEVSDRLTHILSEIQAGPNGQAELEQEINRNLDNVIDKLRKDHPEFKEKDFLYLSYMAMGFDSPTIAFLMDITKNYARVKKSRYRDAILSAPSENAELYQTVFSPRARL